MKKIINNSKAKKIIVICLAIICYTTLCIHSVVEAYSPFSWLLFVVLLYFFSKVSLYNETSKISFILAIFFSFFLILGSITNYNLSLTSGSIWRSLFTIRNIYLCFGTFVIIYTILVNLLPVLLNYNIRRNYNVKVKPKYVFIISFVIILIGWIPYFLALYPGALSVDSVVEMSIIMDNFKAMSNHHPIIHVIFVYIPYSIGMKLFGDVNAAVACSSFCQMIIMDIIFSYFVYFIAKKKVNIYIICLCIFYYAFLPMHGYYSVTMWKDVIFSGLMLILTIQLIKMYEDRYVLKVSTLLSFIIISLLTVFFRNNAIYMFFILSLVMPFVFRDKPKRVILCSVFVIGVYYAITGPVFDALKITRSTSSEYIGMPLQQVARMAYKGVEFTEEETEVLDKLMKVEDMKKYYVPQCSDGIKLNKNYNREYFDKNKGKFFSLWLQLVLEHPSVATEAYAVSTLGYWYPGVNNWTVYKGISENNYNIYSSPKGPSFLVSYLDKIEDRDVPIINMFWSTCLSFWVLLIFAIVAIKVNNKKYSLFYVPVFGIWVTMMLASPVYAEFRYIYSSYTTLPLLMLIPYLLKKEKKRKCNLSFSEMQ